MLVMLALLLPCCCRPVMEAVLVMAIVIVTPKPKVRLLLLRLLMMSVYVVDANHLESLS